MWRTRYYGEMHPLCKEPNIIKAVEQCFSTTGPRPGTRSWHQLYRAVRCLRKLQYATRFH